MRLTDFIRQNHENIGHAWEEFARELTAFSQGMNLPSLRNDLDTILEAIADDMGQSQDRQQQAEKSKGRGGGWAALDWITAKHTGMRLNAGFNLRHVVAEYRALRASILSLYSASDDGTDDLSEFTRFNEAIDQAITEVLKYHEQSALEDSTRLLAILAHDIRSPLNTIGLAAGLLKQQGHEQAAVARIQRGVVQANRLVDDLAVFVRSRSGSSLPLTKSPTDLRLICEQVLEDARAVHANRTFNLTVHGDLVGNWDSNRLTQVLTNLVTNAAIHGTEREVDLEMVAEGKGVVIKVTSRGNPIPTDKLESIFEPMVRSGSASNTSIAGGMGLGLFIVREIVSAHGGTVEAHSSAQAGTTFIVRLPQ